MARSKAAMASSQLVRLSSGSHVSPDASCPTQRTSTVWEHVWPAPAHLELEQLLHLMLQPASSADNRRRRGRLAAQVVLAAKVRPQALDVELRAGMPGRRDVEAVRVRRRTCDRAA